METGKKPVSESRVPPGELLFDAAAVQAAIAAQARSLRPALAGRNPLVLVLMQGALYYAAWLTLALELPLELDYIHASRYRDGREGGGLHWIRRPPAAVSGRTVLLLDDIFDEGDTLAAARAACSEAGARETIAAVMARKRREHSAAEPPDSVALEVPDRFVVGCGLDCGGRWRNLSGIYALHDEKDS